MIVRFVLRCLVGGFLVVSTQFANAQISGQPAPMSSDAVKAFLATPGQLLNQFPDGGPGLVKQVGDLVDSDKATLATLIAIAKTANEDQRKAIAKALAEVAKAYASSGDPAFANQIQQQVANSGLPDFSKAYAEAAGDTGTASTGGGGGGGGGPSGTGAPTGGQNSGFTTGTGGTNTQTSGLVGSSGVGGGGFAQTTTTITNNTETSPH